jgi:pectin methylesterase-like acyl-CoA thioesterase
MAKTTLFYLLQLLVIFTCMLLNAGIVTLGARHHHDATFNYLSSSNSSEHHWIGPVGNRVITVDINGGGQFQSVQDAVNAVPDNNTMNVLIQISAGCYKYELLIHISYISR